jgi:hypothetical protein
MSAARERGRTMRRAGLIVVAVAMLAVACTSPEATRMRASGEGADVGNRSPIVRMHEGSEPYWKTPALISREVGLPDDGSARQADTASRGESAASPKTERR